MEQSFSQGIYYHNTELKKDTVLQRLREHGCRITKQRQILLDVILEQECSSCKEMYYRANAIDSSIGMATVYRMVNVLEEIGVFSRKNLYKVSCGMGCSKEKACVIEFEDHTSCQLSAKEWYRVISEGLKVCGYGEGKKLYSVEAEPCTGHCC